MVIELSKDNIDLIANSFLNKEEILANFKNNPFAKYLVLNESNKIIGYIYYSDIYVRAEINQIEIIKESRNKHKGTLLLREFLKIVNKDVTLEVNKENIYAIKLYENFGFEKKALRKGYYNGIDGILMERKNN